MPLELYKSFNDKNKEDFITVINRLLFTNYIVERTYERGKAVTNPDYRFISYNKAVCAEYLEMIGWELVSDELNGVYSIKNDYFSNSISMNRTTSLILLSIRLIFEEKISKSSYQKDVMIQLSEIFAKFEAFKIFDRIPPAADLKEAFALLHRFNIIDKIQGDYPSPDCIIVIYPSITHAITNKDVTHILAQYEQKKSNVIDNQDKLVNDETDTEKNEDSDIAIDIEQNNDGWGGGN